MAGLKIRKGDRVLVLSGKDKGKESVVTAAFPREGKVIVEGVNTAKRHRAARTATEAGGIRRSGSSSAFGPSASMRRCRTHSVSTPESMTRWATWIFFGPSSRAVACATARKPNFALAKAV